RDLTGIAASQPPALCRYILRERVECYVDDHRAARIAAFLGEMINLAPPLARADDDAQLSAARRDPKLMGDQVRRACMELIEAATSSRPVVLILEDAHWADRATLSLLNRALRDLAERPLLIIALARPEIHQVFPNLWSEHGILELRLGSLPQRAAESLVRSALGDEVAEHRVQAIVSRADGNAFYLEELVRNAAAGRWTLPETVAAMIQARLDGLDPRARRVLRAASVFGESFWRGAVSALLSEEVDLEDLLDDLLNTGLIIRAPASRFPGEPQYAFRHALIREAVYEMLTDDDRRLGHRLAGSWLDRAGEANAEVIADHLERGDARARAVLFYTHAAEAALRRNDLVAAFALAKRGEECGASSQELGRLRRIQMEYTIWRGNNIELVALGAEAMELLVTGSSTWYEVVGETATAQSKLGNIDRAEALAEELRAAPTTPDSRASRIVALTKIALLLSFSNRGERAGHLLEVIEAEVHEAGSDDPLIAAYVHLGRAVQASTARDGDPGLILRELEHCALNFERIGDVRQACLHRSNIGYAKLELGLFSEAESDLRIALDMATQMALEALVNGARRNLAVALSHRGATDEAHALAEQALDWFTKQGDRRMAALAGLTLANICIVKQDIDRATHAVHGALASMSDSSPLKPTALSILARTHLVRDQPDQALQFAQQAMQLLDSLHSIEGDETIIRLIYSETLAATGQLSSASAVIASAHEQLLSQAKRIDRSDWRRSFLEDVPEHARILNFAQKWSI
ncbi:MAG: AAA family ATPase, partial [Myxococcota bacterium]